MRMDYTNGYLGFRTFDANNGGAEVTQVAWVDDTAQQIARHVHPATILGGTTVLLITPFTGIRIDHGNKEFHINTGVVVAMPAVQTAVAAPCDECRQDSTCRRINYCARYRCGFGEVEKP